MRYCLDSTQHSAWHIAMETEQTGQDNTSPGTGN